MDLLAPQQKTQPVKIILFNPKYPLIIFEIVLKSSKHTVYEEPFVQENLLNLSKTSENLWHLDHNPLLPQLPHRLYVMETPFWVDNIKMMGFLYPQLSDSGYNISLEGKLPTFITPAPV